jgi:hypothetical protein
MDTELVNRLDTLSNKLNVATDKLYDVLLLQANIQLMTEFVLLFGSFLLMYFAVYLGKRVETWEEPSLGGAVAAALGIVSALSIFVNLSEIGTIFTLLVNPEYWALDKLMQMLGK